METRRFDNLSEAWFMQIPIEEIHPSKKWPESPDWMLALIIEFAHIETEKLVQIFKRILSVCRLSEIMCKSDGYIVELTINGRKGQLIMETSFNIPDGWTMANLAKFDFRGDGEMMFWMRNKIDYSNIMK